MYVSLLPVVEACVVVAVPGRVGEVRVAADEPEAVDLDPGVLARRLDAPATVKAVLEQGCPGTKLNTQNGFSSRFFFTLVRIRWPPRTPSTPSPGAAGRGSF